MTQATKLQSYRHAQLDKVPVWYRARAHFIATSAVSLPLVAWGTTKLADSGPISLSEWLFAAAFLVIASLAEYLIHRHPLHRRMPALPLAYERHTLLHHRYYTDKAIEAHEGREYRFVFFPVWGVTLIQYGLNLPLALILGWALGSRYEAIALVVGPLFFFLYEFVHGLCHLPLSSAAWRVLRRAPALGSAAWHLREHHRTHHDKSLMGQANFNIVMPLWDWILGTRVLPRPLD